MHFLIAYDIADDRRLRQVAKLMEAFGTRVQRSVFECEIGEGQLRGLMHGLKGLIARKEDKVQVYHLCDACRNRIRSGSQVSFQSEEVYTC
jgi:CRISPR-associated protein Cas2